MENIKDYNSNRLSYGRGYVYSLQYHLIWCTKYRKPVLDDELGDELKQYIQNTMETLAGNIIAIEVMPDHIHLLIDISPQLYIPDMVKILKGNTARWLFMNHPELKSRLHKGHLWNPSYCILTVSERTQEQIKEYILSQKTKD